MTECNALHEKIKELEDELIGYPKDAYDRIKELEATLGVRK